VGSLVIFLAMMYSCHAMGVRGEIVELGRFLMGTVWHGVSFRVMVPRTVRIRCPARTPTRPFQWNPAAEGGFQVANCKGALGRPCAVTPQGT